MKTHADREPGRLLTTGELAARLGLKPDTVRRWARQGRIPSFRAGRKTLRFDLAAVLRALSGTRGEGGAA